MTPDTLPTLTAASDRQRAFAETTRARMLQELRATLEGRDEDDNPHITTLLADALQTLEQETSARRILDIQGAPFAEGGIIRELHARHADTLGWDLISTDNRLRLNGPLGA